MKTVTKIVSLFLFMVLVVYILVLARVQKVELSEQPHVELEQGEGADRVREAQAITSYKSLFDGVKNSWNDFGKNRPYWGVITSSKYNKSNADISTDDMTAFFLSGKQMIKEVFESIKKYNISLKYNNVIDFGCGVCRLSINVAPYFQKVYAIDISQNYLNECMENAKKFNINNIIPVLGDMILDLHGVKFDFIFSLIAIQHNPPDVQQSFIKQLLNLLNKGGIAYLHIPHNYLHKGADSNPLWLTKQIEMASHGTKLQLHFTPKVVIEYIIKEENCELIAYWERHMMGEGWEDGIFLIKKR